MTEKTREIKGPLRENVFKMVLGRSTGPLAVVEVGTARNSAEYARDSDGWSTYWWAEAVHRRGGVVVSIDSSAQSIEESKKVVPWDWAGDVRWMVGDGAKLLLELTRQYVPNRIDILYLDGSDEPDETRAQFHAAFPLLKGGSVVLMDDTQKVLDREEGKGTTLLKLARLNNFDVEHFQGRAYRMSCFKVEF